MGLLSVAIWLPILAGSVLLALGRAGNGKVVRWLALIAALVSFVVTLPLITGFDAATVELRDSSKGNYLGITITVTATSREQLDDLYRALTSHPMVKVVL